MNFISSECSMFICSLFTGRCFYLQVNFHTFIFHLSMISPNILWCRRFSFYFFFIIFRSMRFCCVFAFYYINRSSYSFYLKMFFSLENETVFKWKLFFLFLYQFILKLLLFIYSFHRTIFQKDYTLPS